MTTRADVRLKIREILREFYDVDTVATGGINSSATILPVDNPTRYRVENIIQIENEQMRVFEIDITNSQVTVVRAIGLTTAAAHIATTAIMIIPEFTDRALNLCVDIAVGDTFQKHGGIWIETTDETLTTSTTVREYTIPSGLTTVVRIQVQDDDDNYQENRNWELIGTKIQFKRGFSDSGKTIRLIGTSYQALLSDDTTAFTLSDEQLDFIVYDAVWYALQQRFAHRLKATEYSASVNDRAGQPIELVNMVNSIRRTVEQLRLREFKDPMPGYMTRPRR